jgi:hypothetical protein
MEISISCNGDKGVANCIMGSSAFIAWAQRKKWIPTRSMGCVHTHWGMLAIERWGSPSYIWSAVKKIGEDNEKARKTSRVISQVLAPGPKHDKIWAGWASNVMLENMLKKVWWCKHFEIESWSWTICRPMNCSNGRRHTHAKGGRRSHIAMKCCWKGNVLLSTCAKASRRMDIGQP